MSIEAALQSLVNIFSLAQRPTADPRSLGDFIPSLGDLERADGLVMQPEKSDDGVTQNLDGGDSAHRTGILAFCNSIQDTENLGRFMITSDLMTRHPTQQPWNNPNNSSRDQLLGYIAGCWRAQRYDIVRALYAAHKVRVPTFTCQNTEADVVGTKKNPAIGDLLLPDNLMYFKVCSGDKGATKDIAAQLNLYLAILAAPASEDHEINQILVESIICGQLDIFVATHPNYRASLRKYWGSQKHFRYQASIAESLITVVDIELSRYGSRNILDFLLPRHLLDELKNLDLELELKKFLSGNPAYFAELATRFAVAILRDISDLIQAVVNSLSTLSHFQMELAQIELKLLRDGAKHIFNEAQTLIAQLPTPVNSFVAPVLQHAVALLGLFSSGNDDAEEQAFREQTRQSLRQLLENSKEILLSIDRLHNFLEKNFAALIIALSDEFKTLVLNLIEGKVGNAVILLETYRLTPKDTDLRERIRNNIDELRSLIISACKYGPSSLPYCLHVFGILANLLAAVDDGTEMRITRKYFSEKVFGPLLYAPGGPLSQIMQLRAIRDEAEALFKGLLGDQIVAVRSIHTTVFEYIDEVGLKYFPSNEHVIIESSITLLGTLGNTDSIGYDSIRDRDSGITTYPIRTIDQARSIWLYAKVSPVSEFATVEAIRYAPKPPDYPKGVRVDLLSIAANNHRSAAIAASTRWLRAAEALAQVEALAGSVKTTFCV